MVYEDPFATRPLSWQKILAYGLSLDELTITDALSIGKEGTDDQFFPNAELLVNKAAEYSGSSYDAGMYWNTERFMIYPRLLIEGLVRKNPCFWTRDCVKAIQNWDIDRLKINPYPIVAATLRSEYWHEKARENLEGERRELYQNVESQLRSNGLSLCENDSTGKLSPTEEGALSEVTEK